MTPKFLPSISEHILINRLTSINHLEIFSDTSGSHKRQLALLNELNSDCSLIVRNSNFLILRKNLAPDTKFWVHSYRNHFISSHPVAGINFQKLRNASALEFCVVDNLNGFLWWLFFLLALEASFSLWLRNVIPSIFINIISLYF